MAEEDILPPEVEELCRLLAQIIREASRAGGEEQAEERGQESGRRGRPRRGAADESGDGGDEDKSEN